MFGNFMSKIQSSRRRMEFGRAITYSMDLHLVHEIQWQAQKWGGNTIFGVPMLQERLSFRKTEDEVRESCPSLVKVYPGVFLNWVDIMPKEIWLSLYFFNYSLHFWVTLLIDYRIGGSICQDGKSFGVSSPSQNRILS